MATYQRTFTDEGSGDYIEHFGYTEHGLFADSRIGIDQKQDIRDIEITATTTTAGYDVRVSSGTTVSVTETVFDDVTVVTDVYDFYFWKKDNYELIFYVYIYAHEMERSKKAYELANHLGNVLNVVSDRKISVEDGSTGNTDYYLADVVSYSDYYPFGMLKPGRHGNSDSYRYSLQSKEKDDEWAGEGNSIDFGARMYDPRLGRWRSIDRLAHAYPSLSPYCFVGNTPIMAIDPDGERIIFVNGYYRNDWWGRNVFGKDVGHKPYWGINMESKAKRFFNDYSGNTQWVDGNQIGIFASGSQLYDAGYKYAKSNFGTLTKGMSKDEVINLVGHSMGAAFSAGMAKYFVDEGSFKVSNIVMLSAYDANDFEVITSANSVQIGYDGDIVSHVHNKVKGVDYFGVVNRPDLTWKYKHGQTAAYSGIFDEIEDLINIRFNKNGTMESHVPGKYFSDEDLDPLYQVWGLYQSHNTSYETHFTRIIQSNKSYFGMTGSQYKSPEGQKVIKKHVPFYKP